MRGRKGMVEGKKYRDEGIGDTVIDVASSPLDVVGEQVLTVTLSLHSILKQVTQDLRPTVRLWKSVTTGTAKAYDGQWHGWCEFLDNIEIGRAHV